jgi:hypothetical protein
LINISRLASARPSPINSVALRTALNSRPHGERRMMSRHPVVPACFMCRVRMQTPMQANCSYLVLAKPNVIMNDIRL